MPDENDLFLIDTERIMEELRHSIYTQLENNFVGRPVEIEDIRRSISIQLENSFIGRPVEDVRIDIDDSWGRRIWDSWAPEK